MKDVVLWVLAVSNICISCKTSPNELSGFVICIEMMDLKTQRMYLLQLKINFCHSIFRRQYQDMNSM